MKDKRDILLEFVSNPDAVLNALHQAGWQVIPKPEDPILLPPNVFATEAEALDAANAEIKRLRTKAGEPPRNTPSSKLNASRTE